VCIFLSETTGFYRRYDKKIFLRVFLVHSVDIRVCMHWALSILSQPSQSITLSLLPLLAKNSSILQILWTAFTHPPITLTLMTLQRAMRSLEWIVALLPWCSSTWSSETGVHCDHTVHFNADLTLWLDSPMFWAPWYQSTSTYSQSSFSSSTRKRGGALMYRAESRPGHSTVVSISIPETVLWVKGTGQWVLLG